jgi:hypothetical protein
MIKYEELNIKPISTENKKGTDKIKDIHYKINELLYFYSKKYADPTTAQDIINDITLHANQLKELPDNPKRDEILNKLRDMVKSLIHYKKSFKWENNPNTVDAIQRTLNYAIRNYVALKEKNLNSNELYYNILYLILENHRIYYNILKPYIDTFPQRYNDIKFENFIILQSELLSKLQTCFSFNGSDLNVTKKIDDTVQDDLPF